VVTGLIAIHDLGEDDMHRGFVIAGSDRRFFPAQVKVRAVTDDKDDIRKKCLEVWCKDVPEPVAVRYAWQDQPNANGLHGIPVAPFRTDDWLFIRAEPSWTPDLKQRRMDNGRTAKQHEQWRRDRRITELKRNLRALVRRRTKVALTANRVPFESGNQCHRSRVEPLSQTASAAPNSPPSNIGRAGLALQKPRRSLRVGLDLQLDRLLLGRRESYCPAVVDTAVGYDSHGQRAGFPLAPCPCPNLAR